jgi:hypothetical protein
VGFVFKYKGILHLIFPEISASTGRDIKKGRGHGMKKKLLRLKWWTAFTQLKNI